MSMSNEDRFLPVLFCYVVPGGSFLWMQKKKVSTQFSGSVRSQKTLEKLKDYSKNGLLLKKTEKNLTFFEVMRLK